MTWIVCPLIYDANGESRRLGGERVAPFVEEEFTSAGLTLKAVTDAIGSAFEVAARAAFEAVRLGPRRATH